MKITLLGTGGSAGLPQIGGDDGRGDWGQADPQEPRNRRTRTSLAIHTENDKTLLVDTGPDLRMQLVDNGIARVDAIIYTHAHADHIGGLDDVRILNRILGAPIPAYGTAETLTELQQRFGYAFSAWNGSFFGRPVLVPHNIFPGQTIQIAGLDVLTIDQDHGFSRSLGLRIGDFAYCTDVVQLDEIALSALQGVRTWVVDCFTPETNHPTHAGLQTVENWVRRLKPERTILTHMGPRMDYRALKAQLPPGIEPGHDGQTIDIN